MSVEEKIDVDESFTGKVAVVTGAGAGLGREYAMKLAELGALVVVNDVGHQVDGTGNSGSPAQNVVNEIIASGGQAAANTSSVADWHGAQEIIETAITHFGRLDIVVNNAGINRPSSLIELTEVDVDLELGVHLKGTIAVSHFAAVHWANIGPARNRAIVNTTSAAGLHPMAGGGVYGAAKAGIAALTLSHAQELARLGVRVNAVAPCARTRLVMRSPAVAAKTLVAMKIDKFFHSPPRLDNLMQCADDFARREPRSRHSARA